MESKKSLTLRWMRVMFFSVLLFGSFTASLYLPHQSLWWRVAMILMVAFNARGFVSSYLRRATHRREERA